MVGGVPWNWKSILSPASALKCGVPWTGNFACTACTTRFTSSWLMSAMRPTRMR